MACDSDIIRVVRLLTNYNDPYISDIKKEKAKLYSGQLISEECVICKVCFSREDYNKRIALDFDNPNFPPRLVFPEYYLILSDNEILEDLHQKKNR